MNKEHENDGWDALMASLGEDGKVIFKLAEAYSVGMKHYFIGTEHLFIAMLKLDGSLIQKVFGEFHLDPKQIRNHIKVESGPGYSKSPWQGMLFTSRLQNILLSAYDLALDDNCPLIGECHILLAILQDADSLPTRLLQEIGKEKQFTIEQLLETITKIPWHPPKPGEQPYNLEAILGPPAAHNYDHGVANSDSTEPRYHAGKKPMLNRYGRDLNAEARARKIHAAIGVDGILRQMKRILIQRETNNPLLIGEAGVGKTAIVEGLAYELVYGKPGAEALQNKRIIELSINSLVAGTKYRGELEERVDRIIAEVKASPDVIVFIDEIHTVLGGGSDSLSNIANALKPVLAHGEFHCIGATTINEYRQYIEKDPALKRRFETIVVEEPNIEDCIEIIAGFTKKIEEHHNIRISDSGIDAAVRLSARYLQDERLSAKAIKLLEQAAAYVRLPSFFGEPGDKKDDSQLIFTEVNEDLIRYLLSKKTGIPLERLTGDKLDRIKDIENTLKSQVIGQDEAVKEVSQAIKRSYAQLRDPQRPVGVFLFVGPTGVGKTELARSLAGFLFNDRDAIIRLDMSEYMEKHQVSRLIGAPPGYVGYEEEGQLTGRLRLKPFSVVLLDEIEKALEDVHNLFLQLFDEGRLTDAKGRTVSGREAIFIMTSNIGSELYFQGTTGFTAKDTLTSEWLQGKRQDVEKAIHAKFKPEFLNRVDRIIHFNPLMPVDVAKIFQIQINSFKEQLAEQYKINLKFTNEAVDIVCQEGYDPLNGARPLKRAIDRLIVEPLTDMILEGKVEANDKIVAKLTGSQIIFEKQ